MKMTTRGRYGLRAMLALARGYGGGPVLMSAIAREENLSRKYLHALLAAMKSAGLVVSVRGAAGGYRLSREPSRIRLSEILHAVEGPLSLVECVRTPTSCTRSGRCTARCVWSELSETIERFVESITLASLIGPEAASRPLSCSISPERRSKHNRRSGSRTTSGRKKRGPVRGWRF